MHTAVREAMEESGNLLHIGKYILKNNAKIIKLSKYMCFVLRVPSIISINDYLNNLRVLEINKKTKILERNK